MLHRAQNRPFDEHLIMWPQWRCQSLPRNPGSAARCRGGLVELRAMDSPTRAKLERIADATSRIPWLISTAPKVLAFSSAASHRWAIHIASVLVVAVMFLLAELASRWLWWLADESGRPRQFETAWAQSEATMMLAAGRVLFFAHSVMAIWHGPFGNEGWLPTPHFIGMGIGAAAWLFGFVTEE